MHMPPNRRRYSVSTAGRRSRRRRRRERGPRDRSGRRPGRAQTGPSAAIRQMPDHAPGLRTATLGRASVSCYADAPARGNRLARLATRRPRRATVKLRRCGVPDAFARPSTESASRLHKATDGGPAMTDGEVHRTGEGGRGRGASVRTSSSAISIPPRKRAGVPRGGDPLGDRAAGPADAAGDRGRPSSTAAGGS